MRRQRRNRIRSRYQSGRPGWHSRFGRGTTYWMRALWWSDRTFTWGGRQQSDYFELVQLWDKEKTP